MMKLLGIELRLPRYAEFTAASIMAIGLWACLVAAAQVTGQGLNVTEIAGLLAIVWWSCLAVRCGIDLAGGGWRHWAAHVGVAMTLVLVNDAAWAVLAH